MKSTQLILPILLILSSFNEFLQSANGAKILTVLFFATKSHKNVFDPLLHELAKRNHQVTVVSPVKSKKVANIRDINGKDYEEMMKIMPDPFQMRLNGEKLNPFTMGDIIAENCRAYYELPAVQDLMKNEKFDLVITNAFVNECTYGLISHFNTSFMFISPVAATGHIAELTGCPQPPSFIATPLLGFSHEMNFVERVQNVLAVFGFTMLRKYLYVPQMEAVYKEYVPNAPDLLEFEKNVNLILGNGHFSLNYPRPMMPDLIDVGGMHCRPSNPLPKDLDDFLTGSGKEGFIYFSMGSIVQGSTMPDRFMKDILNAFSKLKQRVLWKWETETMEGLPPNVKLSKWLPQQDVLGHPKIRMFITHGGLLSTQEAVFHGVPLIGIPMFGDQDWNMKQSEDSGYALTLELKDISEEHLTHLINRVLNEPHFSENARRLSTIFRDQPETPLDRAVYWTEYIIRHKGAKHLRSPARDLNFFQYHSIDVIATISVVLFLIFYIFYKTVKFIICKLCFSKSTKSKGKKHSKKD